MLSLKRFFPQHRCQGADSVASDGAVRLSFKVVMPTRWMRQRSYCPLKYAFGKMGTVLFRFVERKRSFPPFLSHKKDALVWWCRKKDTTQPKE